MKIGLIKNCSLVSPDIEIDGATIEIHDNVIHKIYEPGTPLPKADWIHDAAEQFVMPGFIDIHTHGALGYDITDDDPKAVTEVARAKLAEGVTSFCPTTLTLSEEQLSASVQRVADYKKTTKYSKVIGVHLEGPFINSGALGAQNPAFVRKPALEEVLRLNAICKISQVTYAAEVDGGVDFNCCVAQRGENTEHSMLFQNNNVYGLEQS